MKTTQARYEVGIEGVCSIEYERTKTDAIKRARSILESEPTVTAYIYDRMAHQGQQQLILLKSEDFGSAK